MAEVRFAKVIQFYLTYNLAHCHYLTDTGTDTTTRMLNALVGCMLAKGRYFTFNVGIRLNKASQREFGAGSGRRR